MKNVVLVGALALAGCGSVEVNRVHPGESREETCALDVYDSPERVTRPFEIACVIESSGGNYLLARSPLVEARPAACACGADAVVVVDRCVDDLDAASSIQRWVVVQAIRYTK